MATRESGGNEDARKKKEINVNKRERNQHYTLILDHK
jgi:hypothetical protein